MKGTMMIEVLKTPWVLAWRAGSMGSRFEGMRRLGCAAMDFLQKMTSAVFAFSVRFCAYLGLSRQTASCRIEGNHDQQGEAVEFPSPAGLAAARSRVERMTQAWSAERQRAQRLLPKGS